MAELKDLEKSIEAMLFASGDPLEISKIAEALEIEDSTANNLVQNIKDKYVEQESAIEIVFLDGSYQMTTRPEHADSIRKVLELGQSGALSSAALEVLAVIAYNQPVTRAFVEEVRGVDCSSLLRNLVDKDLIQEAGRLNIPGRPIIYSTTDTFLRSFSLDSIDQLPVLPEIIPEDEEKLVQIEGQIDFFQDY